MKKHLIVCCDGTWNAADMKAAQTNVFRLATAIHAHQETAGVPQIVLYLRGVGTTGLKIGDIIEGAIGFGIDDAIRSAYMFLAQNYEPGDDIFLFGFSRGAFTARSLVGLIHSTGLLKRQRLGDIERAWDYYRQPPRDGHSAAAFQAQAGTECHVDVPIKFLGVWDTVGALGIPGHLLAADNERRYGFHDTGPCSSVAHCCHALAIDEHRDQFVPTLWTGVAPPGTHIEQVWFAGAHADVGGGYVTRSLADIPLMWMAKKAAADGLVIDWACPSLPQGKLDALAPTHDSRTGFFEIDKVRPTWREMCQIKVEVALFERLYFPMDKDGKRLATINESIHASVFERLGQPAATCTDDEKKITATVTYGSKNAAAAIEGKAAKEPWPDP